MRALRNLFVGLLKSWTRLSSFVGKEVTEVVRQPSVLASLVLGPFLIMGLFGVGYGGQRRPLSTMIVVPQNVQNLPREASFYQQFVGPSVNIAGVTSNAEAAREELRQQRLDMLVVAPEDIVDKFLAGQQSAIEIEYDQIDPVRDNYARFIAYRQVQELNRVIIEQAVTEGEQYALRTTGSRPPVDIPPEVMASPTRAETRNWAPLQPSVVTYFAPAVLALILQHMGVTLTALSLVRERLSGAIDMFRVAPVRTWEVLVGKYLAYGFLNLSIGALVSMLMVFLLKVPLLGSPREFGVVVALLTFASLGLGLLISILADSERQAVQLAMLVLLASVFFSGFVLPLDEFIPAVQWAAYVLPVTPAIQLLQNTMLRGHMYFPWQLWALGGLGAALFLFSGISLRRMMSTAHT